MVVMSATEEELKRLLVPKNGGPRERRISLVVRIRIAHVRPLDETFDEKEVILCGPRDGLGRARRDSGEDIPFTALRRRAEASFSAMVVVRERSDWTRRTRAVRRYYWFCPTLHLDPRRDRCSRATYVLQHRNDLDAGRSLSVTIGDSFENSLSIASGPLKAHIHFILYH